MTISMNISAILGVLDRNGGLCVCQSYRDEPHDQNPPCPRVALAQDIERALDLPDWTPRRMEVAHNGDQGWLVVTHYPRAIIYGVALDERKATRFHTRQDWLDAREGALQAGLTVPAMR